MLLQQASSSPGPSGTASPKLAPSPRPNPSPSFSSRLTGSPSLSDGASSSNSPRLGANSPKLGASPKVGSPRLGAGSPRPRALEDEAALERLQAELKEGWSVHTGRDGRLYYCKSDSEYYSAKYCTKGAREFAESDKDATTPSRELKSSNINAKKRPTKRQQESLESDEEVGPKKSGNINAKKRPTKRQQESLESDEEVGPKKSKQTKAPKSQPKKAAPLRKIGWVDSDSEDEVVIRKTAKKLTALQSALTRRVADGVLRRTASLEGDVFVDLKVYNSAEIAPIDPKDRWEHAVLALKFQVDSDAPELGSLKKFVNKCKEHFTEEGKFFSSKKK